MTPEELQRLLDESGVQGIGGDPMSTLAPSVPDMAFDLAETEAVPPAAQTGTDYLNRPDVQASMARYAAGRAQPGDQERLDAHDASATRTDDSGTRWAPLKTGLGEVNLDYKPPADVPAAPVGPLAPGIAALEGEVGPAVERVRDTFTAFARQPEPEPPKQVSTGDQHLAALARRKAIDTNTPEGAEAWDEMQRGGGGLADYSRQRMGEDELATMPAGFQAIARDVRPSGVAPPPDSPRPAAPPAGSALAEMEAQGMQYGMSPAQRRQAAMTPGYETRMSLAALARQPKPPSAVDQARAAKYNAEAERARAQAAKIGRRGGGGAPFKHGGVPAAVTQEIDAAKRQAEMWLGESNNAINDQLDSVSRIRDPKARRENIRAILDYAKQRGRQSNATPEQSEAIKETYRQRFKDADLYTPEVEKMIGAITGDNARGSPDIALRSSLDKKLSYAEKEDVQDHSEAAGKEMRARGIDRARPALERAKRLVAQHPDDIPGYGQTGLAANAMLSAEGKEVRRAVNELLDTKLRIATGAAAPPSENKTFREILGVGAFATDDDLRSALEQVEEIIRVQAGYVQEMYPHARQWGGEPGGGHGRRVVDQQRNPAQPGKLRLVYDDGSSEIVDG